MFRKLNQKWKRRPKRKQRISHGRKIRYNWNNIEKLTSDLGVTRENCFVDINGYLRWNSDEIIYSFYSTRLNFPQTLKRKLDELFANY